MDINKQAIEKQLSGNRRFDALFTVVGLLSTFVGMITLAALLFDLASDGLGRISPHFFISFPSRFAAQAGILSAWVGTVLVMIVTALAAIPMGVGAGVYLEEYAPKNWLTGLIEINIANLAGYSTTIGTNFGQPTLRLGQGGFGTGAPRAMQFAGRFSF